MRILSCAQGTPAWLEHRLGLATASNFKRIMTPTTMKFSSQADEYAAELVAERFIGPREAWRMQGETADMQHGREMEPEARRWFKLERDVDVEEVGLVIHDNERWACSPDGLIGSTEGLELKCPKPSTQVKWLAAGCVPAEHLPQVHGALIVTGRQRWWFMSYSRCLPPLLACVEPNEYTGKLRECLEQFNGIYDAMHAKISGFMQSHIDAEIERRNSETPAPLKSFVA